MTLPPTPDSSNFWWPSRWLLNQVTTYDTPTHPGLKEHLMAPHQPQTQVTSDAPSRPLLHTTVVVGSRKRRSNHHLCQLPDNTGPIYCEVRQEHVWVTCKELVVNVTVTAVHLQLIVTLRLAKRPSVTAKESVARYLSPSGSVGDVPRRKMQSSISFWCRLCCKKNWH